MADQDNYKTYVRETRTTESSGTSMALIVGGLVVAVFFILWLVFGGDGPSVTTTAPAGDTTNVTVEPTPAPADTTTNVTIDPAPGAATDGAAPAPAEPAEPAPAAPAQPATNP